MSTVPVISVIDDDPSVRSSLNFLIGSVGLQVESFDSAEALLKRPRFKGCWGSSPRPWRSVRTKRGNNAKS